MTEELHDILFDCLARPETEWAAAVEEACGRHPELASVLRHRFEMLAAFGLTADDHAYEGGFTPRRVGDYEIVQPIGGGSMGTVFLARNHLAPGELFAVKILQPGLRFSSAARARFAREGEIVGRLRHPGLCAVRDAGVEAGVPFLAMDYIEGEDLNRRVARLARKGERPGVTERQELLRIIEAVARALQAAHDAGLVHRDVKPGNIVVRAADGQPVLLDFGLAREVEQAGAKLTGSGAWVGSPAYLAPEAISGADGFDARADVYALGVTLFECLTHQLPFTAPTREALFHQILRDPSPDARRIHPEISPALANVLRVAMAKQPAQRYESATAFADDLRAVQTGRPISVRSPGVIGRTHEWVKRHPMVAGFVVILVVGLLIALLLLREVSRGFDRMRALGLANVAAAAEPESAVVLSRLAVGLLEDPVTVGQLHAAVARYHRHVEYPEDDAAIVWCDYVPDNVGMLSISANETLRVLDGDRNVVATMAGVERAIAMSENRVLLQKEGGVYVWHPRTSQLKCVVESGVRGLSLGSDGETVVTVCETESGGLSLVRRGTSRQGFVLPEGLPEGLPKGEWSEVVLAGPAPVVYLADGNRVLRIDPVRRTEHELQAARILHVARDGASWIAGREGAANWYRVGPSGAPSVVARFDPGVSSFAFAPDGNAVAVLEHQTTIRVFDDRGEVLGVMPAHGVFVSGFVFSPDGRFLASGDGDGVVRIFAIDGAEVGELRGHRGHVSCLAYHPGGDELATGSNDRRVRRFHVRPAIEHLLDGSRAPIRFVDAGPIGRVLWVDTDSELWIRGADGASRRVASDVAIARFVRAGSEIVAFGVDGRGSRLRADGHRFAALPMSLPATELVDLTISPNGDGMVGADAKGDLFVWAWDARGSAWGASRTIATGYETQRTAAIADDGTLLSATVDGEVHVWNSAGSNIRTLQAHDDWVWSVRFAPDGRTFLTTSRDNTARVWDREGNALATLRGHAGTLARGVYLSDGEVIATASTDRTVRLWSRDGVLRAELRGHLGQVWDVAFTPDSAFLVSGAYDRHVRRWPVRTSQLLEIARRLVDREPTAEEREVFGEYLR